MVVYLNVGLIVSPVIVRIVWHLDAGQFSDIVFFSRASEEISSEAG